MEGEKRQEKKATWKPSTWPGSQRGCTACSMEEIQLYSEIIIRIWNKINSTQTVDELYSKSLTLFHWMDGLRHVS